jgi:ubiquitin-conjugating enzyme E2 G1
MSSSTTTTSVLTTAKDSSSSTPAAATSSRTPAELLLAKQLKGAGRNSVSQRNGNLFSFFPLTELQRKPVEGFSAGLADDGNLFHWDVCVMGPAQTP